MIAATLAEDAPRAPRSFLIKFDDATLARLNAWALESGCAATHLITQIVKDVLAEDARCSGEDCDLPKLAIEAQLVFASKMWRRGFDTSKIARTLNVKEAAVANAIDVIKEGAKG